MLRGSTHHGSHDAVLLALLLGVFGLFVVVLRTVMVGAGAGALVFALGVVVALIVALVYALHSSKALFVIYPDRAVIDSRPQGSAGRCVEIAFGELRSVMRDGSWIRMRRRDDRVFKFRGNRLHVEDAFDVLTSSLGATNPDCVILSRQ